MINSVEAVGRFQKIVFGITMWLLAASIVLTIVIFVRVTCASHLHHPLAMWRAPTVASQARVVVVDFVPVSCISWWVDLLWLLCSDQANGVL
jgi:hypothetical protein